MTAENNPLIDLSAAMVAAVEKAAAATVTVDARRRMPASGVAYAADLVLTAEHVVERDDDIHIGLPDGSSLAAVVAGRDPGSDLALLRLEKPAAAIAQQSAQSARVGQLVLMEIGEHFRRQRGAVRRQSRAARQTAARDP